MQTLLPLHPSRVWQDRSSLSVVIRAFVAHQTWQTTNLHQPALSRVHPSTLSRILPPARAAPLLASRSCVQPMAATMASPCRALPVVARCVSHLPSTRSAVRLWPPRKVHNRHHQYFLSTRPGDHLVQVLIESKSSVTPAAWVSQPSSRRMQGRSTRHRLHLPVTLR